MIREKRGVRDVGKRVGIDGEEGKRGANRETIQVFG
jgi:hypothetical protein